MLYFYKYKISNIMDLQSRKYSFIQELSSLTDEMMNSLESALKKVKEENIELSQETKGILDSRLESYHNNPDNLLDWEGVKKSW